MKPTKFKQANRKLLKPEGMTDEECGPLWVYADGDNCISCWRPSFFERLRIMLTGKIWLWVISGHTQPPVAVASESPFKEEEA